ncbi:hypothetical protein [uncultured Kordia sp.]|uniref:hypothetical protein n=1 Tax=uncultured Kordia sp. TaxID=507699 RepID=UPI0026216DFE|nr:hypothetical protein [uncultured Kordia sp.]
MSDTISNPLKYLILGISVFILVYLIIGIGPTNIFGLEETLQEKTGYFFHETIDYFDYGLIALIPFIGMLLTSKRKKFTYSNLIIDIFIILLCAAISFIIGVFILTFIGKPSNPLIPQYLIAEPIAIYSAITIGVGMVLPFVFIKRANKLSEIDEIHEIGARN